MKIVKTFALGAAGALMISGGALAADPLPVNMAAMPPAPIEIGPEKTIDVIALLGVGPPIGIGVQTNTYINVEWPSGWGVEVEAFGYVPIWPTFGIIKEGEFRLYRSIGGFEIGIGGVGGFGCFPCGAGFSPIVTVFYEYEGERLTVNSENYFNFFPGFGFESINSIEFQVTDALLLEGFLDFDPGGIDYAAIYATYTLSDRLEIWGALESGFDIGFGFEFDVTSAIELWGSVWFDAGSGIDWIGLGVALEVNEWLTVAALLDVNFPGWSIGAALLMERPIGNGPWSLIGLVQGFYNSIGGFSVGGAVGVRYAIGDIDPFADLFNLD